MPEQAHWTGADDVLAELTNGHYRIVRDPVRFTTAFRHRCHTIDEDELRAAITIARLYGHVCPSCRVDLPPSNTVIPRFGRLPRYDCSDCGWRLSPENDPLEIASPMPETYGMSVKLRPAQSLLPNPHIAQAHRRGKVLRGLGRIAGRAALALLGPLVYLLPFIVGGYWLGRMLAG
jgi:hypothetical protein